MAADESHSRPRYKRKAHYYCRTQQTGTWRSEKYRKFCLYVLHFCVVAYRYYTLYSLCFPARGKGRIGYFSNRMLSPIPPNVSHTNVGSAGVLKAGSYR